LELYKAAGNWSKAAQVRGSQISRLHNRLKAAGEKEKILQLIPKYEKEIQFSEKHNNKYVLAYNTRHLGQIYLNHTRDYKKAIQLFKRSLALREEIGFKLYLPASYSSVGDAALKMGDEQLAIKMYRRSVELAEESGFVRYQFHPRIKIGDVYATSGNTGKALELYNNALKAALNTGYENGIAEAKRKIETLRKGTGK
ncbi:MAG: tetratricopeptide repeat protein, partial [bacterium]|nr:tetratricopeptide repeat protein [bacterium]